MSQGSRPMSKKSRRARRIADAPAPRRPTSPARVVPAPRALATDVDRLVLVALAIAVAAVAVYVRALGGEFINWDDPVYVSNNPDIRTLSWKTIAWAFTTFH